MTIQPDEDLHVIPNAGAPGTAGEGFRAPEPSPAEQAVIDRFGTVQPAPESNDDSVWAALSDLIPCNPYGDCGDECECAEGELRLAVQRLIMAERVHHADCGDDADCCNRTVARARLVNKAAALAAPH